MKREKKKKRSQESTFSYVTMNQSYSKKRENLKNPESPKMPALSREGHSHTPRKKGEK